MIRAEDTALVLLAAGRSKRFGEVDKLATPFLGQPLALHVVTALEGVPFAARVAVVSDTAVDFAARGYTVVANPEPARGMARSICFGVDAARAAGATAVLVALADMPRVTSSHIYHMLDYATGSGAILASSDGVHPRPPALFGADHFERLTALEGDQGARKMIARAHHIVTSAAELEDIDTSAELTALEAAIRGAAHRSG